MKSVVVFGRQPVAGVVKTRLAEAIGGEAAAAVYGALLAYSLDAAISSHADVTLSLSAPATPAWILPREVPVEIQPDGDLGDRLADAFARRFSEGYDRVVVIGSDCPSIGPEHIREGLARLDTHPAVLGPAGDGGYWLVGQRPPGIDLFSSIPWSTSSTLAATRERLSSLGTQWHELEELADLDTEQDLLRALSSRSVDSELADRLRSAGTGHGGGSA